MRKIQTLNGVWQRKIGNGKPQECEVPFSSLCVGLSTLSRSFNKEYKCDRAFLVFEGITYKARVTLNGKEIAVLGPYIPYRIEITDILKEKDNSLVVEISDIGLPFGSSAGWENYSGIIRDVYVEYTASAFISDTRFITNFSSDYKEAFCKIEAVVENGEDTHFCAVLKNRNGETVAKSETNGSTVCFTVNEPELWSPESPYLYTLECSLITNATVMDSVMQKVGFKDFCTKGRRFYLNGEPYFLLGVNRHDIFGDSGHTLSEEQMQTDMRLIKELGCNFVRLVHYPHNKRIIEIADEIGLLVSEEPGLWWSDMKNEDTCNGALEVLEGVIKRDKNHVSVAFWLSFNECYFTLDFLKKSVAVARNNDPYRMVSGANCMSIEMTKENYLKCGFDFYTMHPYAETPERMKESAEKLCEMPLLFTEWGGFPCDNNVRTFTSFIDTIIYLRNNSEKEPCIAGAVFWEWAETYDFNRGEPACVDGVLNEGLVDMYRNPTSNYYVFKEGFRKLNKDNKIVGEINVMGSIEKVKKSYPLAIDNCNCDNFKKMIDDSKVPVRDYCMRNIRDIKVGPVLPENIKQIGNLNVELLSKPIVINNTFCTQVNKQISRVFIIGNVSMPKGYPISGIYGEKVGEYIVEYTDGVSDIKEILNGVDITTATRLHGSSRINPVAENAKRIIEFSYNKNFEQYLVNLYILPVDNRRKVKSFKIKVNDDSYNLLLYGISAE